jgi:hypothetical protein
MQCCLSILISHVNTVINSSEHYNFLCFLNLKFCCIMQKSITAICLVSKLKDVVAMLVKYFQLRQIAGLHSFHYCFPMQSYANQTYSDPDDSSICYIISEILIGSLQNEHLTMFLMQKL